MGMDVYGMSPANEKGRYFRSNAYAWSTLVDCIHHFAPEIAIRCKGWNYNDGNGLGASDSVVLADKLQAAIDAGEVAEFASRYMGTPPSYMVKAVAHVNQEGMRTVAEGSPHLSVEHLQQLVTFLRSCGCFRIE